MKRSIVLLVIVMATVMLTAAPCMAMMFPGGSALPEEGELSMNATGDITAPMVVAMVMAVMVMIAYIACMIKDGSEDPMVAMAIVVGEFVWGAITIIPRCCRRTS